MFRFILFFIVVVVVQMTTNASIRRLSIDTHRGVQVWIILQRNHIDNCTAFDKHATSIGCRKISKIVVSSIFRIRRPRFEFDANHLILASDRSNIFNMTFTMIRQNDRITEFKFLLDRLEFLLLRIIFLNLSATRKHATSRRGIKHLHTIRRPVMRIDTPIVEFHTNHFAIGKRRIANIPNHASLAKHIDRTILQRKSDTIANLQRMQFIRNRLSSLFQRFHQRNHDIRNR
mmetsp:Transcript_54856/g.91015  ORF Transcript_54856/g.91015 Transcript_54856/m.91015 type:complete len:231 (-) Transcript_54856:348-1040(-)